jgi:hypothetical protein
MLDERPNQALLEKGNQLASLAFLLFLICALLLKAVSG